MPNHVTNIVTFAGPEAAIDALRAAVRGTGSVFSFDRIIPMPPELRIESGSVSDLFAKPRNRFLNADEILRRQGADMLRISDAEIEVAFAAVRNLRKYGFCTWYDWAPEKWGTKWDAYEVKEDGDAIRFQTAWAMPHPVFLALSSQHPDVTVSVRYADEDIGSNCGTKTYRGGTCLTDASPTGEEEAERYACDVWGIDYAEHLAEHLAEQEAD